MSGNGEMMMTRPMLQARWRHLQNLLTREGTIVGPGFDPGPELLEFLQTGCR